MHKFASLRDQNIKDRSRMVSREIAMSLTLILDNGYSLINVAFLGFYISYFWPYHSNLNCNYHTLQKFR